MDAGEFPHLGHGKVSCYDVLEFFFEHVVAVGLGCASAKIRTSLSSAMRSALLKSYTQLPAK